VTAEWIDDSSTGTGQFKAGTKPQGKNWVKVSQERVQIEDLFHKGERTNQEKTIRQAFP